MIANPVVYGDGSIYGNVDITGMWNDIMPHTLQELSGMVAGDLWSLNILSYRW